ncbi:hypothetical protein PR202_ga00663 [Eleusine coracana subsp. coracana]|uniref:Microtubule-binding protein TANGLED1 n=1 Tax=Eleusine coracana subsp. coracana TaxID=191504 RepID=A0AAV5BG88_ELECO|nr:hypothetical protein PR202_ga00663 [Eleusine coracana subsp. coracana]
MSLPAMLLGETVLEIVQASQFARDIVAVADNAGVTSREPKTPKPASRTRAAAAVGSEATPLRARRAREKQSQRGGGASRARVRARIQFRPISPLGHGGPLGGRPSVSANRVSPKNRPWAKKSVVMFPNPAFHASTSAAACATPSPSKKQKRSSHKTQSPFNARQTPHKFLIKSPPSALGSKLRSQGKALPAVSPPPPVKAQASPAKIRRCSFSPSRLATRLVSPIKARLSLNRSRDSGVGVGVGGGPMSGLKQRPGVNLTVRTVSSRISSR